jgi:flavin reductase (DIM6/NTAB) family NADH-FMN oxidoreductase RutF
MNQQTSEAFDAKDISIAPKDLRGDELYFLLRDSIVPRPIAWVSTVDDQGRANLAPYSFFNCCSPKPPILGFSVGPRGGRASDGSLLLKDTLVNIRKVPQCVVNLVPEGLTLPMVETASNLPPGESEFAFAKLEQAPSLRVQAPRVAGATLAFECKLHSIVELGPSAWVMVEVVHIHVHPGVYLGEQKGIKHRIGRAWYCRISDIETVLRRDGPNE